MQCNNCKTLNEEDAIYCKKCGNILNEKIKQTKDKEKKKQKSKVKKVKTKPKTKKVVQKKVIEKNIEKKGMTGFQKFMMFILFILVFGLIGILSFIGYKYYQNADMVTVPNLVGLTYEEAEAVLNEYDLKIVKKEKTTEDEAENNIILKQNKAEGKKIIKGAAIKVTVGIYESVIILENYEGKNIEIVKAKLEELGLKYVIIYEETEDYEEDTIISQNVKEGSKIKPGHKIEFVVAKLKKEETDSVSSELES